MYSFIKKIIITATFPDLIYDISIKKKKIIIKIDGFPFISNLENESKKHQFRKVDLEALIFGNLKLFVYLSEYTRRLQPAARERCSEYL
jgi:hypothetical protein